MRSNKIKESVSNSIYPQERLICSVCGKEFKVNDDTRYIIAGGYTCGWKCFLKEAKKREAERMARKAKEKNDKK